MFTNRLIPLAVALTFFSAPAFAQSDQTQVERPTIAAIPDEVKASITFPADGSTIEAGKKNRIKYEVTGPEVHHGRIEIDGKESKMLRKRRGTYKLPELDAGVHELCLMALDRSHKPIGAASCINVTAQ